MQIFPYISYKFQHCIMFRIFFRVKCVRFPPTLYDNSISSLKLSKFSTKPELLQLSLKVCFARTSTKGEAFHFSSLSTT